MKLNRRHFLAGTAGAAAIPELAEAAAKKTAAGLKVLDLRAEYTTGLLGTQVTKPRLSWRLEGSGRGVAQTAYRIRAASSEALAKAGKADLWDSGLTPSANCFDITYAGKALSPMQRVWWTVEVHDNKKRAATSTPAWFETGLLSDADWKAQWINAETSDAEADRLAGLQWIWADKALDSRPHAFRLDFTLPESFSNAELLVAGKDWLREVWVNGEKGPTPDQPVPNWGTLVPVPAPLKPGKNSVCLLVQAETTGFFPVDGGAMACLIRLHMKDGSIKRLVSNADWTVMPNPTAGWTAPAFDATGWVRAQKSGSDAQNDPRPAEPALLLRTAFTAAKPVVSARLYATALGAYEARLNGKLVSPEKLAPEISVAKDHIFYQTYDVTSLISQGNNALGFMVGDGWYASAYGWRLERYGFGPSPRRLRAQLRLDYADGSHDWVATGPDWQIGQSPILTSEIYDGEIYDARLEQAGWDTAAFTGTWPKAKVGDTPKTRLLAQTSPLLVPRRTLNAKITEPQPGVFVFDFGQNFAGFARLKAKGPSGQAITLKFAEYLKADGSVDQANLRMAKCRDIYTLRGDPAGETWEPRFTYHGFRYVQVENYPGKPTVADIVGVSLTSACAETGTFKTDNAVMQQVWQNALWSQRSNFFAIPTDCPQRDERMGWMGDIQVFLDAACFNMDTDAFIRRFLAEVRAAQTKDGGYPIVVPQPLSFPDIVTEGWSEAGIILPWTLWKRYGDTAVIEENWAAMQHWMAYVGRNNPDFIWRKDRGLDLGDWLSVDAVKPDDETTPRVLCATAYWAYCATLLTDMANATGRIKEAGEFRQLFNNIKQAFAANLIKPDGTCGNGSQTSQVLSLQFNLVPDASRAAAAKILADDIRKRGMKLSTGFLGTPYILDVLADNGHLDVVQGLLTQTGYPSWGYMPIKGATTMWERWNGDTGDLAMNSYNHYAFGAVCGFYYRRLAGIAPNGAGFRSLKIEPIYLEKVGKVSANYQSCLGPITTAVDGNAKGLSKLSVTLPPNATAEVVLPDGNWKEGGVAVSKARRQNGKLIVQVGSGSYSFARA
jgi:alpha-L-rhamnosidase